MILHINKSVGAARAQEISEIAKGFLVEQEDKFVVINSSGAKEVPAAIASEVVIYPEINFTNAIIDASFD